MSLTTSNSSKKVNQSPKAYFSETPKNTIDSPKILPSQTLKREIHSSKDSSLNSLFKTTSESILQDKLKVQLLKCNSNSDVSSDDDNQVSDHSHFNDDQSDEEFIQIGSHKSRYKEFTHIFPAFPKTNQDGYTYIIELSDEILNETALLKLRDALQYSLTGGGGARVLPNVKFFSTEGQETPMKIQARQCAGIFL